MSKPLLVLRVMGRPPNLHSTGRFANVMVAARVRHDRRALVKVLAQGVRHAARMGDLSGPFKVKRRIHVTIWWQGTKRDDPNMLQDLKADIDGLVDAGWLVNDNREWMELDYPPEYVYAISKKDISVEYRLFDV